jgi:hypothetical protein
VDALIVANKSGLTAFKAKVYIDATGDGDLAAYAGASFKRGDENGVVQSSTMCFSFANVDTYNYVNGSTLHTGNKNSPVHAAVASGNYPLIDPHFCNNLIGADVVQFNAGHLVNVDSTDPWALSQAMITGRQIASNATLFGYRRSGRHGSSPRHQTVEKRCAQNRCAVPAQKAERRRTVSFVKSCLSVVCLVSMHQFIEQFD